MNHLFPPELRTASVVRRWSIVRTIHPDSVAEHQFYVAFYAVRLAQLLQWRGPVGDLMFYALMHDAEELVTGDIVSPVKRGLVDEERADQFIEEQMHERLPLVHRQLAVIKESEFGTQIERIVKVADKVDACIFLILEQTTGNTRLAPLYQDAEHNLITAVIDLGKELGYEDNDWSERLMADEIGPALAAHWKHGGIGIT